MTGASSRKSAVRRALTENLGLKILALAAAIALFVIVRGTENAQISVAVDVVALLPPASTRKMLVTEIPDQVRITLRGSRSVLNAVRRGGLTPIQMDLRSGRGHFYYFEPDTFDLPAGASIVQIAPSAVPLRWVERAEGRVRVDAVVEGEVAGGNTLASTSVDPATVRVTGAAAEVARLQAARTAPVDIDGLAAGHHPRRVPLAPLPEHVSYVDTPQVVVTINVEEEIASRTLADLDVAVVGASEAAVRPAQVSVHVRGPRARVDALSPGRIVPFVDVSALEPARGAQPVAVQLRGVPEGVEASAEPAEVLVTLPSSR